MNPTRSSRTSLVLFALALPSVCLAQARPLTTEQWRQDLQYFARELPRRHKMNGGCNKVLLRRLLDRYVPRHLVERPKKGFDVPIAAWLRGPLRDWAEDLLDETRLSQDGLFNPAPIRRRWTEHQSGSRNWQHALWTVLMFQEWKRRWA